MLQNLFPAQPFKSQGNHSINPDDPADAGEDPDGDGFTNLDEYKGKTDLTVSNDDDGSSWWPQCFIGSAASGAFGSIGFAMSLILLMLGIIRR